MISLSALCYQIYCHSAGKPEHRIAGNQECMQEAYAYGCCAYRTVKLSADYPHVYRMIEPAVNCIYAYRLQVIMELSYEVCA